MKKMKHFTIILAHFFNNYGYCTYWQQNEVNFIKSLGVLR
jgi:hypothetical protein